jgi:hypothetical protein
MLSGYFLVDPFALFSGSLTELMKLGFFLCIAFITIVFVFYDILFMEIPDEVLIPSNLILFFLLLFSSLGFYTPIFSHLLPFHHTILDIPLINALVGSF